MAPKSKIVIVEDEFPIQEMYRFRLELGGYEVRVAENGAKGLKLIEEFRPDLALVDLRMPVMTGDEMLARLRSEEWGSHVRIIVLTNISKSEAPHTLRFLNIDRYIVKAHYTPAQVVDIVREVLG